MLSIVPDDADEMTTDFPVNGVMYYVDPQGNHLKYEDVLTETDMCRAHFKEVSLGTGFAERFIH